MVKRFHQLTILGFRITAAICLLHVLSAWSVGSAQQQKTGSDKSRVGVTIITDEADAVLAILKKQRANQGVLESDWKRLFSSEGYVRLKKREEAMKRGFEDSEFKTFVLSSALSERTSALEETLARWKTVNVEGVARRVLNYLPKNAHIHAKVYPEIKPRENSFVFDVKTDPAIFLYIDPKVTKEKFENTLAHELHHIGFGTGCPPPEAEAAIAKLPQGQQIVLHLMGAFGEGFAMLAAAGGPNVHPHAVSPGDEKARWDKDVANYNSDLKLVEKFFLDVVGNKLTEEATNEKGGEFFGIQGPWYTVGWKMAVTIEKRFGRAKLIECMCDRRKLLSTYNKAAVLTNRRESDKLALWSDELTSQLPVFHHPQSTATSYEPCLLRNRP